MNLSITAIDLCVKNSPRLLKIFYFEETHLDFFQCLLLFHITTFLKNVIRKHPSVSCSYWLCLSWKIHILEILNWINICCIVVTQVRQSLNIEDLKLLHYLLVYLYLFHCKYKWRFWKTIRNLYMYHKNMSSERLFKKRFYHTNDAYVYLHIPLHNDIKNII